MAKDLSVVLDDRPGELARVGEATAGAGVNIDGFCCLATGGGRATVHILVEDVTATRTALQSAGLEVGAEREVIVVDVEDRPGAMAQVARKIADAGAHRAGVYNLRRCQARAWGRRLREGARGGLTRARCLLADWRCEMKPRIDATDFGSITVDGTVFDHDVVISPGGEVSKRKEKLSKAVYGTSHTISLEEARYVYGRAAGADRLIVGAGQYGRVRLSPEAADFFARNACEIVLLPTPVVIGIWNETEGRAVGLFHVTC